MKEKSYLLIILGAIFWGLIGIFVQKLYQVGFSSLEIVTLRVTTAAIILISYVYYKDKSLLKIKAKDSIYFIGTGICSIVFFSWCYFTAIQEVSLSVAVILLYTAPAFVAIFSRIVFKELLTTRKVSALGLTLIGTILVVGFPESKEVISFFGLLIGLGSGIGYALYSIFSKAALDKYDSLTITTYTFIFASLFLLPITKVWTVSYLLSDIDWLYVVGLGLIPTVLAYMFYTYGLSQIESSKAAITATIEPVVATLVGIVVYNEVLSLWQLGGIIFILAAVVLINLEPQLVEDNQESL